MHQRKTNRSGGDTVKVLISEDASFVRKRYVHLVSRLPSVTSVVETSDVADTVKAILAERPALVLLDFHLPAGTALDVMRLSLIHI